jgi:hypothetical protein
MQIFKRNRIVLCAALAVMLVITSIALRSHGQNNLAAAQQEDPSPVQEGVQTEKQQIHGKLFSQNYTYRRNQKLRSLKGTGDLQVTIGVGDKPTSSTAPPFNLDEFLRTMVCDSDAVVIGEVKNRASQLTEYGEFAFTDYEVTIEEILKNNTAAPIMSQGNITVTRPGGAIQLNGKIIRAVDLSYKPFEIGGRFLLFLKFIPASGAYQTFSSQGSFKLVGNEMVKQTKEFLPQELESQRDASSFINKVRHASVDTCNK